MLNPIIVQVDPYLLIRYGWLTCCVFVLVLLASPLVSAQESNTEFTEGQTAEQTVAFLPGDWNVSESPVDIITLPSSVPAEDVTASNWWDAKSAQSSTVAFTLVENMDKLSNFLIHTNSNKDAIYSSELPICT